MKDEIIFDKSKKNLKKVYNRIQSYIDSASRIVGSDETLFLAIGGYNRTYDLLIAMGLKSTDIASHSFIGTLSRDFVRDTHMKKVLYVNKINYLTKSGEYKDTTRRFLSLNVADSFEESLLVYKHARRKVGTGANEVDWIKPTIVILNDPSLNLQFDNHRLRYANDIGFVQIRNRNTDPYILLQEIKDVEEADKMMFARYKEKELDDEVIMEALNNLRVNAQHEIDEEWFIKPSDYKRVVGSNEVANALKEIEELGIKQLKSNKRIGRDNARWVVIPESAFEFRGFDYKDDDEIFEEEIRAEEEREREIAEQQEAMLEEIMSVKIPLNVKVGYIGKGMGYSGEITLQDLIDETDTLTSEMKALELLDDATTNEEYTGIKATSLVYFLDGHYTNDQRNDDNYEGGKRLVVLDVDEGDYTRSQIEDKLETNGLFGLVYPTARHYFDNSQRWRVIMLADNEMDKESYKNTTQGVAELLGLEADDASKKISQLMGYPLQAKDVSTVVGSTVNVAQFKQKETHSLVDKVVRFRDIQSTKSLRDFKHKQVELLNRALEEGIPEGQRNDSYFQIIRFLRDTQNDPTYEKWHEEAEQLESEIISKMYSDGLSEQEVSLICR